MTASPDIIVSGHLCLDLLPQMAHVSVNALTIPGRLSEVGPLDIGTGGAVSNTGLALHRLGARVALMSKVGDDLLGQVILAFLAQHDPSLTRYIPVRAGERSSYTIVISPSNLDRVFLHCTGPNATFTSADIDYTVLKQAKLFHLGYPPILPRLYADNGDELVTIYRKARETGVITSMDMSLPDAAAPSGRVDWRTVLKRVMPLLDVFVPSLEEVVFMLRPEVYQSYPGRLHEHITQRDLRAMTDELFAMGDPAILGFKLGEYGVYLRSGSETSLQRLAVRLPSVAVQAHTETHHPAFQVEVVGTTGAGDSAYAALLMALLKGESLDACARWMCAVGAHNVEAADATSGIRSWEETGRRVQAGWLTKTAVLSMGSETE